MQCRAPLEIRDVFKATDQQNRKYEFSKFKLFAIFSQL